MMRIIGPEFSQAEREQFVAAARSLLHVRWQHQGRDKRGIDCGGLLAYSLKRVGRKFKDAIGYSRLPYRGMLEELVRENFGDPLPADTPMQEADVALMRFVGSEICHCGIITNYPYGGFALIHAFAQNREVVEHRIDAAWMKNIIEVYRP